LDRGERIVSDTASTPLTQRLTLTHWLILIMASIGFAFDIYVLLVLPLILPPALAELLPNAPPGSELFNMWRGLMFWVPALVGGAFGLVGGYLTDRLGRRRVLTWSILLYGVATFFSGLATSMTMLLVLRSLTFVGVCVEFVAAVAWLAELFPDHNQRERALGYTQAFSSIGGLIVSGVFLLINKYHDALPAIRFGSWLAETHAPWRYMMMSGLVPAIPLIIIRPFLPESPVWQRKKDDGTLRRPSFREVFAPALRRTTIVTTIMMACSYGAAFGAIQQIPQIVPGLPEVKEEAKAALDQPENQERIAKAAAAARARAEKEVLEKASISVAPDDPEARAAAEKLALTAAAPEIDKKVDAARAAERRKIVQPINGKHASRLAGGQEIGGLIGRFLLALLVVRIVSRRNLLRIFVVPGLVLLPFVFGYAAVGNVTLFNAGETPVTLLHVGMFLAGMLTVAQFSFWGNYLPVVYPVHLRGTGESVAANVGGRMIGTGFAYVTSVVSGLAFVPGASDPARIAYTAAGVALFVYLVNLVASFWLPEPKEANIAAD
jgi:MFS family permease